MDLITDLRKKIESHHEESLRKALRALDVLKGYFSSDSAPPANGVPRAPRTKRGKKPEYRRGKSGSYREQVCEVIRMSWTSIEQIAQKTGLGIPRIRGVVNATALKEKIESREIGGTKEYRLKED